MINLIAAIDSKRGIADEKGIPWQGRLPGDVAYFRQKTIGGTVVMGYATYAEFDEPLSDRRNVVASRTQRKLREGFELVTDIDTFINQQDEDVWVIGGAGLFATIIEKADRLYLSMIDRDFHCTKFFPEYSHRFKLIDQGEVHTENSIEYRFTIWERRS